MLNAELLFSFNDKLPDTENNMTVNRFHRECNGVSNISIVVYNMTKRTNPTINALSTIVILVIAITLILVNVIPAIARKRKAVDKK